jgi:hypothetical protein
VRTKPLIGRKAWFGPRRLGWGLSPVSIEGWLLTLLVVGVGVGVAAEKAGRETLKNRVMPAFVVLILLKGTSPGGRRKRREFEQARDQAAG